MAIPRVANAFYPDTDSRSVEARIMAALRRAIESAPEEVAKLASIARSRTEPASGIEGARVLLAYRDNPSFFAVSRATGVRHQTVRRCVGRAVACGWMEALDDRPRPGREPTTTADAKPWLVSLPCQKPGELGFLPELWTTRLLPRHARDHGLQAGHNCLAKLAPGMVCNIFAAEEIKPHKVRYYLEKPDAAFGKKMPEVLCIYRQVRILTQKAAEAERSTSSPVAIVSCDEKPGIQAIENAAPELPPVPGEHPTVAQDHSKLARAALRHTRVASNEELTDRIMADIHLINRDPVVHTWSYMLEKLA
jgi:hypothetical protein